MTMNSIQGKPGKPGILVVDHDGQSLQETRLILEEQGFRVYTASDGLAALDEFKRQQPSLVILAAMLPKLHGFEVCRSIKRTAGGANIPVIITTRLNKNEKYKRQAMQKFKADDFLVKPLSQEKLLGLVKQHLGKPAGERGERARSGPREGAGGSLERILEDTLAGLMRAEGAARGEPVQGRSGIEAEGRPRPRPITAREQAAESHGAASSRPVPAAPQERDPHWDPEQDEEWDELDEDSVVSAMPAALAEVDEDEIDRIVDSLEFFAEESEAPFEEAPLLPEPPAPAASGRFESGVRAEAPRPAPPTRSKPEPDEAGLARRTVAVTPVEMVRSAPSPPEAARPPLAAPAADLPRSPAAQPGAGSPLLVPVGEGQHFGKYLLLKKIATGGMAEVFRAKQIGVEGFEKLVALKRILPHLTDNDEFIKMFIDEGKLAAQLTHTNIVQIYELGEVHHSYYIAMEYVHGKNLKQILHRAKQMSLPMTIEKAVTVASKIGKALDYAHRKCDMAGNPLKLVHRDVSPQNVLISYEGEVKLVDFGIAKAASQASITRAGALKGKILYMSPEQAWGKPIDHRSDIYSVGNLLYEMVTGRKLFAGQTEVEILKKVRDPKIAPPSHHAKDMPAELEKIILKALEVDPDRRFQDASSMKRALDKYLFKRKVALGALNLGSYVQNLFQDEFQQDTAESLGQVDLPSVVLTEVDAEVEAEVEELDTPVPAIRVRAAEAPGRASGKSRRALAEDLELTPEPSSEEGFERTLLSPRGAPAWLYVMIGAVVLLLGLVVYLLLGRPTPPELVPEPEETASQPQEAGATSAAAEATAQTAPAAAAEVAVASPEVSTSAAGVERPFEPEVPAATPETLESGVPLTVGEPASIGEARTEVQAPSEASAPEVSARESTSVPTPQPSPTARPSPTPRPTRTPRPTSTPKAPPLQAAVQEPPAEPEMPEQPTPVPPTPVQSAEVVYGESRTDSEAESETGKIVIKRAEPRFSPTSPEPAEEALAVARQPTAPAPAAAPQIDVSQPPFEPPIGAEPQVEPLPAVVRPTPVRENDLVEFPDTQLEFVEQGQVLISSDLRRKLKRALGRETLSVRFFVRAEISIKGQVTRIDSMLKGAKDAPQLTSLLSPSDLAELDQAFLDAAKTSRFKPLIKDGVKVRSVQTIFLQIRVP
jgi:serine/threonine protein kinase/DNA-binding NarL/FixJ family response regulator